MIAYMGNWHNECPSDEQIAQYSHIVIAFAVSYTWDPVKNICDTTCQISSPSTCGNQYRPDLIRKWQTMGKKVILSFGGAGMGGSWTGDNNDCWEHCFGREQQVVDQLTYIVNDQNLDGVDIDYEYFYENDQNGSGFTRGDEAQTFLKDVTLGLRATLPDKELTHAPMEPDIVPGTGYYDVLKEVADSLDFLMPQYYNGFVRPLTDFPGALHHYSQLTDDIFDGDSTKIIFGFCIGDCNDFNMNGEEAKETMELLGIAYPCNGGAFFWLQDHDVGGLWSAKVNEQLTIDAGNCPSN
jgi:chitinase